MSDEQPRLEELTNAPPPPTARRRGTPVWTVLGGFALAFSVLSLLSEGASMAGAIGFVIGLALVVTGLVVRAIRERG